MIRRREFITLLGGAAAAWPLAAWAQQSDQRRRIGVLTGLTEDDPENQARLASFRYGLERRGWSEGRNLSIDYRFAPAASPDQAQPFANSYARVALRFCRAKNENPSLASTLGWGDPFGSSCGPPRALRESGRVLAW